MIKVALSGSFDEKKSDYNIDGEGIRRTPVFCRFNNVATNHPVWIFCMYNNQPVKNINGPYREYFLQELNCILLEREVPCYEVRSQESIMPYILTRNPEIRQRGGLQQESTAKESGQLVRKNPINGFQRKSIDLKAAWNQYSWEKRLVPNGYNNVLKKYQQTILNRPWNLI